MQKQHYGSQVQPPAFVLAILATLDKQKTDELDWPADAQFCVRYSIKAWPTNTTYRTAFFTDADELKTWYIKLLKWATLEDNYFDVVAVWEWELGPNLMESGRLPFDRSCIDLSKISWS